MSKTDLFLRRAQRYFERVRQQQLDKTNPPPPYSDVTNSAACLPPNGGLTAPSHPNDPSGQTRSTSSAQLGIPDAPEAEILALRRELELQRAEGMCVACGKELEEAKTGGIDGFSGSTLGLDWKTKSGYQWAIESQTKTILNGWRTIICMDRLLERKSVKLKSLAKRLVVVEAELARTKRLEEAELARKAQEEADLARREELEETTYLSKIQSWAMAPVDWVFEELERFLSL